MTKPPLDVTVVATGNRPRTLLQPPQQPGGSGRCALVRTGPLLLRGPTPLSLSINWADRLLYAQQMPIKRAFEAVDTVGDPLQ